MSTAGSIPDTSLGFTQSELLLLRQQQDIIATQSAAGQSRGNMTESRGRGHSRHGSQPSSRNASVASSGSFRGRVQLESGQLGRLTASLDNLLRSLQARMQRLEEAVNQSVEITRRGVFETQAAADKEKKRFKKLLDELDEIDEQCEEIQNVRKKLKQLKERVDKAGGRLDNVSIQKITTKLRD